MKPLKMQSNNALFELVYDDTAYYLKLIKLLKEKEIRYKLEIKDPDGRTQTFPLKVGETLKIYYKTKKEAKKILNSLLNSGFYFPSNQEDIDESTN